MSGAIGLHAAKKAKLIYFAGEMREKVRYPRSVRASLFKLRDWWHQASCLLEALHIGVHFEGYRITGFRSQPGLEIEQVHLRRSTLHPQQNHPLRLRSEVRCFR